MGLFSCQVQLIVLRYPRRIQLERHMGTHAAISHVSSQSPSQPPTPAVRRYDVPGDEPLAVSAPLKLDEPFRFDRGLAKRLRMREVNATEAFTLRDESGAFFRASVQAYDAKGGRTV